MLLILGFLLLNGDSSVYGEPVHPETIQITIEQLMADPEKYLGKMVSVRGKVKEVCPMAGCWVDMTDKDQQVRIKVKDGEIVFDKSLVGKQVQAHGTVYKFDLDHEQAIKYFQHLAEEKNETFDPSTVKGGTTIYQIGGLGLKVI